MESVVDKIRVKKGVEIFGLSESFLRHAIMNRTIKSYKLGRTTFISRKEIEQLIESGKVN